MAKKRILMAGRLTTHVLDTAQGCPAGGLTIELWRLDLAGAERTLLKTVRTNADGRTDGPLLIDGDLAAGTYELVFAVGAYFASQPVATSTPPFLDRVPVRFTVADPQAHYHVPLLVSPWAYSTYRGS
jgi:5-hydroxyisourate hydrolase